MRRGLLAVASAGVLALGACTAAVTQPASPKSPVATSQPAPAPTPETGEVRNPYEAGAQRDWSFDLSGEPTAVTFDRQSGTAVAAVEEAGEMRLEAFQISSAGVAVEAWSYRLPASERLLKMDAASGRVYVSTTSASSGSPATSPNAADRDAARSDSAGANSADQNGAGVADSAPAHSEAGEEPPAPSDLIILDARRGKEEFRWTKANALDPDVLLLVGAYDSGAGIVKLTRERIVGAVIDETGRAIRDELLFTLDEAADSVSMAGGLVRTNVPAEEAAAPVTRGSSFIMFPAATLISGDACWSAADGAVCVVGDGSSRRETGRSAPAQVIQYDERGNPRGETDLRAGSAALVYEPVAFDADVTVEELVRALVTEVDEAAAADEPTGDAGAGDDSGGAGDARGETAESPGGTGDAPGGAGDGQAVAPREPAMLHAGEWHPLADLDGDIEAGSARLLLHGAPFTADGINLLTGEALGESLGSDDASDKTSDGSAETPDPDASNQSSDASNESAASGPNSAAPETRKILAGSGQASDMFFEWDGSALHYLKPRR